MVDLDADEDQSGGDGGDACRPEEGGGCDGHVRSLSGWSVAVAAGMPAT